MEKIIKNNLFNTSSMEKIASWSSPREDVKESLYFSDNNLYLLHCEGNGAILSNAYGTESFGTQDLIILKLEDVMGWLDVHAPEHLEALYSITEDVLVDSSLSM